MYHTREATVCYVEQLENRLNCTVCMDIKKKKSCELVQYSF